MGPCEISASLLVGAEEVSSCVSAVYYELPTEQSLRMLHRIPPLHRYLLLTKLLEKLFPPRSGEVEMLGDLPCWCLCEPLLSGEVLEHGGTEHFQKLEISLANVLDVMGVVLWDNGDIACHVIERPSSAIRRKDGNPRMALEKERPFVGVWMPMHLTKATFIHKNVCSGSGLGYRKVC